MWVIKLKLWHPNSLTIDFMKKHDLTMLAFPLNTYVQDEVAHLTTAHIIIGEEENKAAYIEDIKKVKKIKNIEVEGDLVVYSFVSPVKESHIQMYFTPEIFLVKPIMVKSDGFQYIELASWDKKYLTEMVKNVSKFAKIVSQSIKREKLTDIYFPHLFPKLTKKQREAILLAYRSGYYDYPKQTNIEKLAKSAKLSQSTFQEHLRKAEQKLIPFLLENIAVK